MSTSGRWPLMTPSTQRPSSQTYNVSEVFPVYTFKIKHSRQRRVKGRNADHALFSELVIHLAAMFILWNAGPEDLVRDDDDEDDVDAIKWVSLKLLILCFVFLNEMQRRGKLPSWPCLPSLFPPSCSPQTGRIRVIFVDLV